MPKTVHEPSPTPSPPDFPIYPADLEDAMQDTLARLADVELIYKLRREMLGCRSASERQTERLRAELESVYQSERQPHSAISRSSRPDDEHHAVPRGSLTVSPSQGGLSTAASLKAA
jgi:hypothetical protein